MGQTKLLTTQFYIKGDPANAGDSLFGRMSDVQAASVSMEFTEVPEGFETTVNLTV